MKTSGGDSADIMDGSAPRYSSHKRQDLFEYNSSADETQSRAEHSNRNGKLAGWLGMRRNFEGKTDPNKYL